MDFNLKQWRNESEEEEDQHTPSAKQPRLLLNNFHPQPSASSSSSSSSSAAAAVLPLFVSEPTTTANNTTTLSAAYSSDNHSTSHRMGSSYFSLGQWQELELQALIFRHMIAGAAVPPELLHLVKKSLITSHPPPYFICNPLHQYQSALLQTGYWGKAAMDPEPGRCRRTDGKKWRCSRDVVAGHKYCERHMHRGRNRSRKPVEIPTSTSTSAAAAATVLGGNGGGAAIRTNHYTTHHGMAGGGGGGGAPQFSLSGHLPPSMDLLHLNPRPLDSIIETKCTFESQNDARTGDGGRTLRHFFDDWPRSDNADVTDLSISMPGDPPSDFSLKLGTGNGDDEHRSQVASGERGGAQLNWGPPWETNRVAPMGGPLAEALRSSVSTSSPTSVLHRRPRSSASEASYVST